MKKFLRCALFLSVVCSLLPSAQQAAAATKASLVRVTLTSSWPTHSPDPMGLTYNPRTKKLLISDSEVDEIPALWKGKNLFITDDDLDRVFRVGRGKDKKVGTRDDVVKTVLHTHRFGSLDPEGLAWRG